MRGFLFTGIGLLWVAAAGQAAIIDSFSQASGQTALGEVNPDELTQTVVGNKVFEFSGMPLGDPLQGRRRFDLTNFAAGTATMSLNAGASRIDFSTSASNASRWILGYGISTSLNFNGIAGGEDRFRVVIDLADPDVQLSNIFALAAGTGATATVNAPLGGGFVDVPYSSFTNSANFFDIDQLLFQFDTVPLFFQGLGPALVSVGGLSTVSIPEPGSLVLAGLASAMIGMALWRRGRESPIRRHDG